MAYKPTGYKKGRPRKGEIRPETPGGKANARWRRKNPEKSAEINREGNRKFVREKRERWDEIQRGVRLRKKGWDGTKLIVGDSCVNIKLGKNQFQVILVQADSYE